jgi:type I restriction enzyme S subunit
MRLVRPEYAKYLEFYFQAQQGGQRQYRRYIYGAGRPHLSFEQLRQTVVPLPGISETDEIVARLETVLSRCDHQLSLIEAEIERSDSLRESILRAAFSGKLVAQDPSDEPVSLLLERIRSERELETKTPRRKNKNSKKEAA